MHSLLEIKNLRVKVNGQELLRNVNLVVPKGNVHALLGPNGSGKTSLMITIMGYPKYKVCQRQILFDGEDISGLDITARSRLGIGVTHQRPPTMAGVKMRQILDYITAHEPRHANEAALLVKISPEKVEYLQSRGMEKREAISMIIRGFLDADIEGLGPELDARIAKIAELAGHKEE